MAATRVKVLDYDLRAAQKRSPMRVIRDSVVDLPARVDAAREELAERIPREFGGRVRTISSMVPSGFLVTVER